MIGILASAISISEDIKIRQLIRKSIISESKLLVQLKIIALLSSIENVNFVVVFVYNE
jgi:hypothetical protein